jgi:hypothetical protein
MTNDRLDPITGRRVPGDPTHDPTGVGENRTDTYPGLGKSDPTVSDPALALDDTDPGLPTSGQSEPARALEVDGETGDTSAAGSVDAGEGASQYGAPGRAADEASAVKDTALDAAGAVKEAALERGNEVADTAKQELSRLAGDARDQFQGLWSEASGQIAEHARSGQQQLADLVHSLADELGVMASRSDQDGPLTSLAKQAAQRGGAFSHWLSNAEPGDVMAEVRRFARRRPFVFLASATLAGVVVGRLSRGLMAAGNNPNTASSGARAAAERTNVPAPAPTEDLPAYGGGTAGQTYGYSPVEDDVPGPGEAGDFR